MSGEGVFDELAEKVFVGGILSFGEACCLMDELAAPGNLTRVLYWGNRIRVKYKGNKIRLCSIINAKSGNCPENCAFCSQSGFNNSVIKKYPFVGVGKIKESYFDSCKNGVDNFSVVTSGRRADDYDDG